MVNSQINKEIRKAELAYGYSLIKRNYQDFHQWSPYRNREGKQGFYSRETKYFSCEFCGKVFVELDSLRTPAYLRYRTHRWRCERKDWEEELKNFHSSTYGLCEFCAQEKDVDIISIEKDNALYDMWICQECRQKKALMES